MPGSRRRRAGEVRHRAGSDTLAEAGRGRRAARPRAGARGPAQRRQIQGAPGGAGSAGAQVHVPLQPRLQGPARERRRPGESGGGGPAGLAQLHQCQPGAEAQGGRRQHRPAAGAAPLLGCPYRPGERWRRGAGGHQPAEPAAQRHAAAGPAGPARTQADRRGQQPDRSPHPRVAGRREGFGEAIRWRRGRLRHLAASGIRATR